MNKPTCPDAATLAELLAGRLPAEQAEIHEPHLAHCGQCLARAEELGLHDELTEALRDTGVGEDTASVGDASIVNDLIGRLSGIPDRPTFPQVVSEDELQSLLAPPQQDDELGRLGHHRVLEVLGAGGMGIVFKAEDEQLGRTVAIKVMKPQLAASRDACRRFQREACAAAAFEHNHVVTIYHVDEDRGIPYFSMQLLEGESLRSRIEREGKLPTREVLRIGREIATGLDAAHRRGLLHRDIKPDNVWLEAGDDQVKIVDFGLARTVDQPSSVSNSGTILGTPKYMAPEQVRGGEIDARCDLFSLGSLLFHASTGEPAFSGSNLVATLVSVSQDEVTPPQRLNPELPPGFSRLLLDLLAKDPAERPQTASETAERIKEIEASLDQQAFVSQPPRRRRPKFWLAAAAGAFLLVAAAIIYVVTDRGTLLIDADDSVAVLVEGEIVTIRDLETGREYEVTIGENTVKPGVYEIFTRDKQSGVTFSSREFSILRGRERRVAISMKGETSAGRIEELADSGGAKTDPPKRRLAPAWLRETEDTLGIQPGDPLSDQVLVKNPATLPSVASWTVEPVHHHASVNDAAFCPTGSSIATAGRDGTIRIWDVQTRELQSIIVCPGSVHQIAWTSDGRYLASSQGEAGAASICVWDVTVGGARLVTKINRSTSRLAWSPDNEFLAFVDNGVQFWEFETGEILTSFDVKGSLSDRPWAAEGLVLATTSETGIHLWDVAQREQIDVLERGGVREAIWSREGKYIVCLRRQTGTPQESRSSPLPCYLEVWDVTKRQRIKSIPVGNAIYPGELAWSPDQSAVVHYFEDAISLWDLKSGTKKELVRRERRSIGRYVLGEKLGFSPDARRISLLIAGSVELWDLAEGRAEWLTGTSDSVRFDSHSFVSESDLLATTFSYGERSALWDLKQLQPLVRIEEDGWMLAPSPNGKRLAAWRSKDPQGTTSQTDLEVRFYRLPDARQVGNINVRVERYPLAVWSPDSHHLAFYSFQITHALVLDGTKVVQELGRMRKEVGGRFGNRYPSKMAPWSPDSKYLAWTNWGGDTVEITDVNTGEKIHTLTRGNENQRGSSCEIRGLAWSPDGSRVARVLSFLGREQDTSIQVWGIEPSSDDLLPALSLNGEGSDDVVFSPDGRFIASSRGSNTSSVWDVGSGEKLAEAHSPDKRIDGTSWLPDSRHVCLFGVDSLGVLDIETGKLNHRTFNSKYRVVAAQNGTAIALGWWNHIAFFDAKLALRSTWILPADSSSGVLSVQPNGAYRIGPGAMHPRIVALSDGVQRTLTPEEFSDQYGWVNDPLPVESPPAETTTSLDIEPGQPISPLALVQKPKVLPGVRSWTIEPIDHRSQVANIEFSPDGGRVATSGRGGVVRVWDTDHRELQDMIACPGTIRSMAWSPDGNTLATSQFRDWPDRGSVCLWNVGDGVKLTRQINRPAWTLSWSPTGDVLAGFHREEVWLWDESSQAALTSIVSDGQLSRRPWSPDGQTLAIASDHGIELWNVAEAKLVQTLPTEACDHARWLQDGESVACLRIGLFSEGGSNVYLHRVEVWNTASRERTEELTVARLPKAGTVDVSWSTDEQTIATNINGKIELWDRASGERKGKELVVLAEFDPSYHRTSLVKWSPSGKHLAYLDKGVARFWDFASGQSLRLAGKPGETTMDSGGFGAQQGILATTTHSEELKRHCVWDLNTSAPILQVEGKDTRTAVSPDGRRIAVLQQTSEAAEPSDSIAELLIYRVPDSEPMQRVRVPDVAIPQIVWSPDSRRLALAYPTPKVSAGRGRPRTGFATVVDALEGKVVLQLGEAVEVPDKFKIIAYVRNDGDEAQRVAFSPDGTLLASWRDDTVVTITKIESGQVVHTLQAPRRGQSVPSSRSRQQRSVFGIAWSSDGRRLAYVVGENYGRRNLVVWNVSHASSELLADVPVTESGSPAFPLEHVLFSADGRQILTGVRTKKLDVWDASNGRNQASLDNDVRRSWASWLPGEQTIAFQNRSSVGIWTPANGDIRHQLSFHGAPFTSAVASNGTIAVAQEKGHRITLLNADLTLNSSWIVDPIEPDHILGVYPDGRHRTGPGTQQLRVIVLSGSDQKLLTVQEFAKEHGWRNTAPAPPIESSQRTSASVRH